MGIRRFDHAAVNSRDIGKSRDFYVLLLGLREAGAVDMGECILHYFGLPDGSAVEVFELKDHSAYDGLTGNEGFLKHIAFAVDDIDAMNDRLVAAGVRFDMPLCLLEPLGAKALLCRDPDGVVVELSQKIK